MTKSVVSAVLKKDKEIREARAGFQLLLCLFGLWSLVRLANLGVIFSDHISLYDLVTHLLMTVFVVGVTVLAAIRAEELSTLRQLLAKEPQKVLNVRVSGPPVLTTLIPFLLK